MNRRRFLKSVVAAAASPAIVGACSASTVKIGPLRPDPNQLLDLPDGFDLSIVSRAGDAMSDGLKVPSAHDGMAAFAGDDGNVILVCNHEMLGYPEYSAFGTDFASFPDNLKERVYDWGNSETPGSGGTTTTIWDPKTRTTVRQFLSLSGTEINCAGGKTPWGSWLTCEESFSGPGVSYVGSQRVVREEKHGYVFEVPANADGLVEAIPLRAMGRFEHEAAAVHEPSGIVYMTEDRYHSLFYRFIPDVPGNLREGGRLQALAIRGRSSVNTHNWGQETNVELNNPMSVEWIDLDDVNPDKNNLRLRGAALGAATFARGEGLSAAGDVFVFTCTIGGPDRFGQIFSYAPGPFEGTTRESEEPGTLELIAECTSDSLLQNPDNLTMAPWGDLIVCEDTEDHCGLVGIRPDGRQYALADNAYSDSELAGVCFSPDGKTLFVNIQYPGMTVAITGPWPT